MFGELQLPKNNIPKYLVLFLWIRASGESSSSSDVTSERDAESSWDSFFSIISIYKNKNILWETFPIVYSLPRLLLDILACLGFCFLKLEEAQIVPESGFS